MTRRLERGGRLVVASHNKGKVWEIGELLAPYGLAAVSASELGLAEPAETETTFRGNALIKARAAAESGLPSLADDSGLEIDILDGAPGVYSADWAGPGRDFGAAMHRVFEAIEARKGWQETTPPPANFISVLCLAWPGGEHAFYEGKVHGHLVWPPRGGNGFGYDPMFVPDGESLTFGEMEPKRKYAISHRTRAFEAFRNASLPAVEPDRTPAQADRAKDGAGLTAAAANLSTREELAAFVANLRAELARGGEESSADTGRFLEALASQLSMPPPADEPSWRTFAKALHAARLMTAGRA